MPFTARPQSIFMTNGIQLDTATYTTPLKGKNLAGYDRFHGFCLETQPHPISVHHAEFPTTILRNP